MIFTISLLALLSLAVLFIWLILKTRNADIWFSSYIKQLLNKKKVTKNKHIYVCLADHYEPYFGDADKDYARSLVDKWVSEYRDIANRHTDSDGNHPRHSYFYPIEEYDEKIMDDLKGICNEGLGDVDIHLHHDDDTSENLLKTLNEFKELLFERHGLLRKDEDGNIVYGFIHGNWALANSRPDGKWCGVDNEIEVLVKSGCVFDMTMPSAPSNTQTKIINKIYFSKCDGKPKSHDKGREVEVGRWAENEELLMIQGPLSFNWKNRKLGLIPKIDSGELSYDCPPDLDRIKVWENCGVSIKGAEEHIFIKLYTHGLQVKNMKMFFDDGGFETLWSALEEEYKEKDGYKLHYMDAWQMYLKLKELSLGTGN